jgi:RecB family exonuclease
MATGNSVAPGRRLVASTSGARRLAEAAAFFDTLPAAHEIVIVSASRAAADELARAVARGSHAAVFGWHRFSLLQLAVRLALHELAAQGRSPSSPLGAEAVAARAVFDARSQGVLEYFEPIAHAPGFPGALARTLGELRMAQLKGAHLVRHGEAAEDLAALLDRMAGQLDAIGAADRALLLETAASVVARQGAEARALVVGRPIVLLDLAVKTAADTTFVTELVCASSSVLATVSAGDEPARKALERAMAVDAVELAETDSHALGRARSRLFALDAVEQEARGPEVQLFSAPGEAREAVEIARRVLDEARRGVRFDDMAVLVRAPFHYLGLLEHALDRAGIPAWFDRGTRRPDPAGRALLALLLCAEEGLSARRFAEYLSLAQVPDPEPPRSLLDLMAAPPADEVMAAGARVDLEPDEEDALAPRTSASFEEPVVDGSLRTPWRWEALLVESAVIGGLDRWVTRLNGLEQEYRRRLAELRAEEPEAPRAAALARDLDHLSHLRAFALPVIRTLDEWQRDAAQWGTWLERLMALAPRVLRRPTRVLRILAELGPMSDVGPVALPEVRGVLSERLRSLAVEPPSRRYGRLFVGSPDQARGHTFRVVFVPGLAERVFPQKVREDPLLLDEARRQLAARLPIREDRAAAERLQLRLALGAATERVYASFPRLDVSESRPRVPSFYALDIARAATGTMRSHEDLQRDAYDHGGATLAWPAPRDPERAIDTLEHDLAVLRPLLDTRDPAQVAGRARYLLELNDALGRSVRDRWARYAPKWSDADGLIRVTDHVRSALDAQRLGARPYSLSALQHYSVCPYRFLLSAIYRLAPREDPVPLQRLDPLTKGSVFHRVQAEFLRALRASGRLPITPASLDPALETLAETLRRVAADERARLAPAIGRVWDDEIETMHRDLRRWVELMAGDRDGWVPHWFELAFGLEEHEGRDEASLPEPVVVDGRFRLRGSIDLVERHATGALRVTDHKTGRARWPDRTLVGGGEVLQPILYSLALEAGTNAHVYEGRLWFCTAQGEYKVVTVPLTDTSRRAGLEVLEVIDRALEQGLLAQYPKEGGCAWCDFRAVCGSGEESRIRVKPSGKFLDLITMRGRP